MLVQIQEKRILGIRHAKDLWYQLEEKTYSPNLTSVANTIAKNNGVNGIYVYYLSRKEFRMFKTISSIDDNYIINDNTIIIFGDNTSMVINGDLDLYNRGETLLMP